MTTHQERYLGTASEHVADDSLVNRPRVLAERFQSERVAQALDDRRLAGAPATDQHVEIRIEAHRRVVQKAASLPRYRDQFGVRFNQRIRVQANPRTGVEERLSHALNPNVGHLHPARRRRIIEVVRRLHVAGVQDGDGEIRFRRMPPTVIVVSILDDRPYVLRKVVHRARNLNGAEVVVPPGTDPGLAVERLEQPVLVRDVRRGCPLPGQEVLECVRSLLRSAVQKAPDQQPGPETTRRSPAPPARRHAGRTARRS